MTEDTPFKLEAAPAQGFKPWQVDGYRDRQPEMFVGKHDHPAQGLLFGEVQPGLIPNPPAEPVERTVDDD